MVTFEVSFFYSASHKGNDQAMAVEACADEIIKTIEQAVRCAQAIRSLGQAGEPIINISGTLGNLAAQVCFSIEKRATTVLPVDPAEQEQAERTEAKQDTANVNQLDSPEAKASRESAPAIASFPMPGRQPSDAARQSARTTPPPGLLA